MGGLALTLTLTLALALTLALTLTLTLTITLTLTLTLTPTLTRCAWAAFLGNVAIETKELTIWKEIKCATQPPYCGRGPLQITGSTNYAFCASQPVCNCPELATTIESPAHNEEIGFGTVRVGVRVRVRVRVGVRATG